jgi:hypothetical protein
MPLSAFLDPEYAAISGVIYDGERMTGGRQQDKSRLVSANPPTTTASLQTSGACSA